MSRNQKNGLSKKEIEKRLYNFRLAFLISLIVLMGSYIADVVHDIFNFKYYYVFSVLVPITGFLIVEYLLNKQNKKN
jgi:hypothetical protein